MSSFLDFDFRPEFCRRVVFYVRSSRPKQKPISGYVQNVYLLVKIHIYLLVKISRDYNAFIRTLEYNAATSCALGYNVFCEIKLCDESEQTPKLIMAVDGSAHLRDAYASQTLFRVQRLEIVICALIAHCSWLWLRRFSAGDVTDGRDSRNTVGRAAGKLPFRREKRFVCRTSPDKNQRESRDFYTFYRRRVIDMCNLPAKLRFLNRYDRRHRWNDFICQRGEGGGRETIVETWNIVAIVTERTDYCIEDARKEKITSNPSPKPPPDSVKFYNANQKQLL